ncbi:MAG: FadR family transcriptional regulator [Chloroflexi bacterium]|nr:FadR family transcriptional regulator [Chloroflexota bacterium]
MSPIDLGSELLNYIVQQHVQPGERLPSISELQDETHLGISISKVREQLEVARALGLVEVRSKTGTRLKEYDFAPAVRLSLLFALARDLHYFELFSQLRNHLEVAFWHEACALLQEEDKAFMRACIAAARAKLNDRWIRIPHQEHRAFHLTVFKRLDNPFVTGLLEAYWDAYDAAELNQYADYDYLQKVWDYHERILDAICAGDYEQARQEFIDHTRLLRYQPRVQEMQQKVVEGS